MGLLDKIDKLKKAVNDMVGDSRATTHPQQQSSASQNLTNAQPVSTQSGLYNPELEKLIDLALTDGKLTEKEKQILFKKAETIGVDLDEFEMVLDACLYQRTQAQNPQQPQQPVSSAPKSDKYGDVKKCPACGAMIESFTARCSECGHEFSNVAANSSIQKLFEMLNQVETQVEAESSKNTSSATGFFARLWEEGCADEKIYTRKKEIIQNFPVPTTKDDILEFLSLTVPLAKKPGFWSNEEPDEMQPIWKAKCEQIIIKARFSMKNDPKILVEIEKYAMQLGLNM